MDQAICFYRPELRGQEAVEHQLGWKPKLIEVNNQQLMVELWPVWKDALYELVVSNRDPYGYEPRICSPNDIKYDQDYLIREDYWLRDFLQVHYVSENFEIELLVHVDRAQIKDLFPAKVTLLDFEGELKPCDSVRARVQWENGRKQSATCSVRHTSNDDFDLIQSVRGERRKRGIKVEESCAVEPPNEGREGGALTAEAEHELSDPINIAVKAIVSGVTQQLDSRDGSKKPKRKYSTYIAKHREEIYEKWRSFIADGGKKCADFLNENEEFCKKRGCDDADTLKRIIDSARKAKKGGGMTKRRKNGGKVRQ